MSELPFYILVFAIVGLAIPIAAAVISFIMDILDLPAEAIFGWILLTIVISVCTIAVVNAIEKEDTRTITQPCPAPCECVCPAEEEP